MPVTTLTLVRHGESEGNVARERAEASRSDVVDIGPRDADVALTATGAEQARALGRWLAGRGTAPPSIAITSPYRRARRTLELALDEAGVALVPMVDERLRDRELGILDKLTGRGVVARFPDEAARRRHLGKLYYRPPGGESWADVALRVRSWLTDVDRLPADGELLVATHDAVIMLVRYVCEGLDEDVLMHLARTESLPNASVTRFHRADAAGRWQLAEFGTDTHVAEHGARRTEHGREHPAEATR